jgi:hypothetical protein
MCWSRVRFDAAKIALLKGSITEQRLEFGVRPLETTGTDVGDVIADGVQSLRMSLHAKG